MQPACEEQGSGIRCCNCGI